MDAKPTSHGIEGLITRLHGEGVESGRREGERVLNAARAEAAKIIASARSEALRSREEARAAAAAEREAVSHALTLAHRDTLLALKEELCVHVAGRLRRLIAQEVRDPELLRRMLLSVIGDDKLPKPHDLDRLLANTAGSALNDGTGFELAGGWVRIHLSGNEVVVDLSDASLTELLSEHLLPRFLARLNGVASD
jgi:V/A-type H+-transporting ATPase subunit E